MESLKLDALSKGPVPNATSTDVARVWSLISLAGASSKAIGIDQELLTQHCSVNADVLAVFLRASLIEGLLKQGILEEWRHGEGLHQKVFEVGATFPLSIGPDNFDSRSFVAALK